MVRAADSISTKDGFTLVEILIAMVILVAGVVVAAGLFAYAATTLENAELESTASLVIARKIEELSRFAPAGPASGGGLDPANPLPAYSEHLTFDGVRLRTRAQADSGGLLLVWQVTGRNPTRIGAALYSIRLLARGFEEPLAYANTTVAATF